MKNNFFISFIFSLTIFGFVFGAGETEIHQQLLEPKNPEFLMITKEIQHYFKTQLEKGKHQEEIFRDLSKSLYECLEIGTEEGE